MRQPALVLSLLATCAMAAESRAEAEKIPPFRKAPITYYVAPVLHPPDEQRTFYLAAVASFLASSLGQKFEPDRRKANHQILIMNQEGLAKFRELLKGQQPYHAQMDAQLKSFQEEGDNGFCYTVFESPPNDPNVTLGAVTFIASWLEEQALRDCLRQRIGKMSVAEAS